MLGIGPQWTYLKQNRKTANSIAGELAGDFMFWPANTASAGFSNRRTITALRVDIRGPLA